MAGGRFKELLRKYGKVALGVHFSVSGASIAGLYVAVKNNVDVETMLEKVGMPSIGSGDLDSTISTDSEFVKDLKENKDLDSTISTDSEFVKDLKENKERNRTSELAATSGGALALAFLINKALFPVRVPITLALTPPVARFLARRNLVKTGL